MKSTVIRCEYIWLDGGETQSLRSKTRVLTLRSEEDNWKLSLKDIPMWTFDGSSTNQGRLRKLRVSFEAGICLR